jgi:FG-GAP-like repeat/Calx-beta domain/FG-GAP repeat
VAIGDLNGDGLPDLAVATIGGNVSVLLNTTTAGAAAPSFAAAVNFTVGSEPISVAIGDLNGDGRPDLAVANVESNSVSVLLNTTTAGAAVPSFAAQQSFAVGTEPFSVAIGDLNGDGRPDLAVANLSSNSVSVLLNTTTAGAAVPSFAAQQSFAVGSAPISVAIGDLNGDGLPDLAVANYGLNGVSVLLNTTTPGAAVPSFTAAVNFAVGSALTSVAIGDLNGDGLLDLVVANYRSNSVSVLLNTTTPGAAVPSFAAQQSFATGTKPESVAIGDLNGDGQPDLAVANFGPDGNVSVLLNTTVLGAATITPDFPQAAVFATGSVPASVAVGDLNGDGKPDIVVSNISREGGGNTISVLLNTTTPGAATPSFAPHLDFGGGDEPVSVALADLNGDGRPDIVVVDYQTQSVGVLINQTAPGATTPSFAPLVNFAVGPGPAGLAIGDLNGDGKPDLVVTDQGSDSVSVLLNTTTPGAATPSFVPKADFAVGGGFSLSVAIGDFNGDGRPDLAVANAFNGTGGDTISVLLNTTTPGATAPSFATHVDFATRDAPSSVAVADLNGDGRPDIAVASTRSNSVAVFLNVTTPGGTTPSFDAGSDFATGSYPIPVAIADLNGDGRPDIVAGDNQASALSVLLNSTAPGTAVPAFGRSDFMAGSNPLSVAIADFNGDGRPDLVSVAGSDNDASVLLNTPETITTATATGTITESDPAPTVQFSTASQSVNENGGALTVTVTLTGATDAPAAVPITFGGTAAQGTDYTASAASVTIPAGLTSATFTITPIDDNQFSSSNNKTVLLGFGTLTNASARTPASDTVTITESDPKPTISFASATQTVNENAGTFTVAVNLSAASSVDTTVPFTLGGTAVNGVDYSGVTASPLVIAAGQTTGTITGTLIDDGAPDAVKTFTLTLGAPTNATLGATTTDTLTIADSPPPPPPPQQSLPPFVSVAFGPSGEVVELVNSAGVLTQFDAAGAHVLGGGVRSASVAFGSFGEVLEVVGMNGILTQFDASGAHQLGGPGVESASVAFGPGGEVLDVVLVDSSARQFSAGGVQVLATSGVVSVSIAFGPSGSVVEVLNTAGVLTQYDASGVHQLGGAGVQSAGVAFTANSLVLDIIFSDGTLDQFDAFGVHRLGMVT